MTTLLISINLWESKFISLLLDSSVHPHPYCSLRYVLHRQPRKTNEGGTISVHLFQRHCHQHGNIIQQQLLAMPMDTIILKDFASYPAS